MMQELYKEQEGYYYLQGVLTHKELAKAWLSLLQKLSTPSEQKVMLNLAKVEQVDSAFLAFLLALLRVVQKRKAELSIECMSENIKALMQVQGIWPLFEELIV